MDTDSGTCNAPEASAKHAFEENPLVLETGHKVTLFDLLHLAQAMNPTQDRWKFLAGLDKIHNLEDQTS